MLTYTNKFTDFKTGAVIIGTLTYLLIEYRGIHRAKLALCLSDHGPRPALCLCIYSSCMEWFFAHTQHCLLRSSSDNSSPGKSLPGLQVEVMLSPTPATFPPGLMPPSGPGHTSEVLQFSPPFTSASFVKQVPYASSCLTELLGVQVS